MNTELTIANTTWGQIGFWGKAEVGAKNPTHVGGGTLRFNTTNLGGVRIEISLNSMDTYDIETFKVRKNEKIKVKTFTGIYNDQLTDMMRHIASEYAR